MPSSCSVGKLDGLADDAHGEAVDRYKALLLLLALAVIPLFYASVWLGVPALIAIYALLARLAGNDLDRRQRKKVSLRRLRKERPPNRPF